MSLGVDPKVKVRIEEDNGNLFIQFLADQPDLVDLDGAFFNLTDPAAASDLVIFPSVDDLANGNVTGFAANPGALDTLSNGAVVADRYDVKVEFGQLPSSTAGDVNDGKFTFYLDSLAPLTVDSIDLSSLTAVVNSDDGTGQVLQPSEPETTTEVAFTETFDRLWHPAHSQNIVRDDHWDVSHGRLQTDGDDGGVLQFAPVDTDGPVGISFDIRADCPSQFEARGWGADKLSLQVRLDDGRWQTLDDFVVDEDRDVFVGSETGQTFGGHYAHLDYSGGILDEVSDTAEFRFVSDISSSSEDIYIDNVSVTRTVSGEDRTPEDEVVQSEDFGHLWFASQSDIVEGWTDWDVKHGMLHTDGRDDGRITFEKVETDGDVRFNFDAKTPHARHFEQHGWHGDSLKVQVQVDDGDWNTLDTFVVNDKGTALVGSETGQEIGRDFSTLSYEGGVLETASSSVQFRFVSDISHNNENIYIDNVELTVLGEEAKTGDDAGSQYDIVFDSLLDTARETVEDPAEDLDEDLEEDLEEVMA
ncbi:hypothetical protein RISW2_08200 [Roseivivax isoporae LMG 25204]|uniref:Uncharacterized protein n=1 Tax=Roseivivax isoporae LMG 25204 TaxID=1449351 RepID=X7FD14_9RHOB|nr:hypothetical protein RISW2_08200 [Roseivivax isoporae LMG 25204]